MLKVHVAGHVLATGRPVNTTVPCVVGRVCVCQNEEEFFENFREGDILVAPYTVNAMLPMLRKAGGIIAEQDGLNSHAAITGMALDIPVIVGSKNATKFLRSGSIVSIDTSRGTVSSKDNSHAGHKLEIKA